NFSITIDSDDSRPVYFGYSLEFMQVGSGWEIVFIENDHLINVAGPSKIEINIPTKTLSQGTYYLNLFISSDKIGRPRRQSYDQLSWTNGRPIMLNINSHLKSSFLIDDSINSGVQL